MKTIKFMAIALVAMIGLNSCSKDCGHDFIEYDYSQALVGTWTCMDEDFAEALVIKADGSFDVTGVVDGEFFETTGTIKVVNNKVSYKQENGDEFEGRLEMISSESFSLVFDDELDIRYTYRYCKNDLADEIVGMWVCHDGPNGTNNDMSILSFQEDGTSTLTGILPNSEDYMVALNSTYKVVGDLQFQKRADVETSMYIVNRLIYSPNETSLGDVLTHTTYISTENGVVETTTSWLRIKQSLDLANTSYDYSDIYVSNVKCIDKDIEFMGHMMNFATFDGSDWDKMLKSSLFNIEFPDAKTISCTYNDDNGKETYEAPIVVEGNKLTVKMSQKLPTLKDVVFYAFQDADNSQMHIYMHKTAFVNFYTNMQAMLLAGTYEQFDITNTEAVDAIYNSIDEAVETINISVVMKAHE